MRARENKISLGIDFIENDSKNSLSYNAMSGKIFFQYLLMLVLAAFGTVYGFFSGINMNISLVLLSVTICIITLCELLIVLYDLYNKKVIVIAAAIYIFIGVYYYRTILGGLVVILNQYIELYNQYYHRRLDLITVTLEDETLCLYSFLIYFEVIFILILILSCIKSKKVIVYGLFTIPILALSFIVGYAPNVLSTFCYFIGTAGIIAGILFTNEAKKHYDSQNMVQKSKAASFIIVTSFVAILFSFFAIRPSIYESMNMQDKKGEFCNFLNDVTAGTFLESFFGPGGSSRGYGGLYDGDLGNLDSVQFKQDTVLKLTTSNSFDNCYLKTYVGEYYDHDRWCELSSEEKNQFESIADKYPDIPVYNQEMYILDRLSNVLDIEISLCTIENVAESRLKYYCPYFVCDEISYAHDYVRYDSQSGSEIITNYYSYDCAPFGSMSFSSANEENDVPVAMAASLVELDLFEKYTGLSVNEDTIDEIKSNENFIDEFLGSGYCDNELEVSSKFQNNLNWNDSIYRYISDGVYMGINSQEYIQKLYDVRQYVKYESEYRKYVYDVYTKLPEDGLDQVIDLVKDWYQPTIQEWDNVDDLEYYDDIINLDYKYSEIEDVVNNICTYLATNTEYTLHPGRLEEGKDFVTNFLFEKKKGYCSYYASAAAVMLRAMGIPARYVEGYAVSQEELQQASIEGNRTVDVRDSLAHAWIEVYMDGFGWYPYDVTAASQEEQTELKNQNKYEEPEAPSILEQQNEPSVTDEEFEGNENKEHLTAQQYGFGDILLQVIVGILCLFVIFLFSLIIRRKLFMRRFQNRIMKQEKRQQIISYYKEIGRYLSYLGITYDTGKTVEENAEECFVVTSYGSNEQWKEFFTLIILVRFSQAETTEQQLLYVSEFIENLIDDVENKMSFVTRLYYKYIKIFW